MINIFEVNETNKMIEQENLDVRTITLGISLLDCIDSDLDKLNEKIYNKITKKAENLVSTGEQISAEFGIPIVNKRISVTPIALIGSAACKTPEDFVSIAKTLDHAAKDSWCEFYRRIFSSGKQGHDTGRRTADSFHSRGPGLHGACVQFGKCGLHQDRYQYGCSKAHGRDGAGDGKSKQRSRIPWAVPSWLCSAMHRMTIRLWPAHFHGVTEADCIINVGVSGPGVVKTALTKVRGADFETLCEMIKRTAFKVTRVGQLVAQEASKRLGVPFGIVDLSLAPTPAIGDSVAEILEEIGLERVGAPGTTAALALLK